MFSNVGKKCFKLWCVVCAVQFVGDKNLSVIKMHGTTTKNTETFNYLEMLMCLEIVVSILRQILLSLT